MSNKVYLAGILVVLVSMLVAACASATPAPTSVTQASPTASKTFKLLIVDSQTGEPYESARQALLTNLASFGYVQGQNLVVTQYTIGNDKAKGIQTLQSELGNNYDVVFLNGTIVATAAKEVALNAPGQKFVFACVTDPVGVGLIDDFVSPPKANFTGVSYPVPVKSRFHFILQLMPHVKTIGLIYADMPQSQSYKNWVEDLLKNDPEFKDLKVIFRMVPLVTGEDGPQQMAELAKKYVQELDPVVDVFVSPNDQMGVNQYFAQMVYATATKPLVGVGLNDVTKGWGATMSLYPSHAVQGKQCATMIKRLFEGEPIKNIIPETPQENGYAFDLKKAKQFGIEIPIEMIQMAGENIVQ